MVYGMCLTKFVTVWLLLNEKVFFTDWLAQE